MKTIKDSVCVGYVHPGTVHAGFTRSFAEACLTPENKITGIIEASSARQHVARNSVIAEFLKGPCEWLMWIDTDMTFERDAISRLRVTAQKHGADMVSGLGFVYDRQLGRLRPNAWTWDTEQFEWVDTYDYKPGSIQRVDGSGSGFLLVHRRVFEKIGKHWHQNYMEHPANGQEMGHDLAFALVAKDAGFKMMWDTNVKTGHIKTVEMDEAAWLQFKAARDGV